MNQSNLGSGMLYVDNQSISYTPIVNMAPKINIKTIDTYFKKTNLTTTLNSNQFRARVIGTGGQLLNLLPTSAGQDVILSTVFTTIYTTSWGLLSSGLINIRYSIPNPALFAWRAGVYANTLDFVLENMGVGSISIKANAMSVTVDPFIKITPLPNVEFTINSLDFYRSRVLDAKIQSLSITATQNAGIRIKSNTPNFTFSNGYSGSTDPRASANVLSVKMMTPTVKPAEYLTGTTFKTLTAATGIEVPVGNTYLVSMGYGLSTDVIKSNFLKKGTYTLNLAHEVYNAEIVDPSPQSLSSTMVVNVADMAELIVNQQDVNLVFKTAEDYKNGVYVDMPAHFSLSATSPYELNVRSSASVLSNGSNSIPVTALQITAVTEGIGEMVPLTLKETNQRMFSILPVIDQKMNVRYSINAAEAAKLIGKASGTYTTSITYSLIAP